MQGNAELSDTMQAPPFKTPTSGQGHKGTLFLWQDHWQVLGQLMPNRSHRHISASLLVGLDSPFRLAVDGEWRETRAAIVAPDVPRHWSLGRPESGASSSTPTAFTGGP